MAQSIKRMLRRKKWQPPTTGKQVKTNNRPSMKRLNPCSTIWWVKPRRRNKKRRPRLILNPWEMITDTSKSKTMTFSPRSKLRLVNMLLKKMSFIMSRLISSQICWSIQWKAPKISINFTKNLIISRLLPVLNTWKEKRMKSWKNCLKKNRSTFINLLTKCMVKLMARLTWTCMEISVLEPQVSNKGRKSTRSRSKTLEPTFWEMESWSKEKQSCVSKPIIQTGIVRMPTPRTSADTESWWTGCIIEGPSGMELVFQRVSSRKRIPFTDLEKKSLIHKKMMPMKRVPRLSRMLFVELIIWATNLIYL